MIEMSGLTYLIAVISAYIGGIFTIIAIKRGLKKRNPITANDIIDKSVVKEFDKLNKALEYSIKLKKKLKEQENHTITTITNEKRKAVKCECGNVIFVKDVPNSEGAVRCDCGKTVRF